MITSYLERSGTLERLHQLTARQNQVLKMIAEGGTMKSISSVHNLSAKTIETYRAQIMDKLDIHDIPGLVRYAIRQGLIELWRRPVAASQLLSGAIPART